MVKSASVSHAPFVVTGDLEILCLLCSKYFIIIIIIFTDLLESSKLYGYRWLESGSNLSVE